MHYFKFRKMLLAIWTMLAITGLSLAESPVNGLAVFFIDVGQGDCTLLLCDDEAMMIDAGDKQHSQYVCSFLQNELFLNRIDHLVVTHAHLDHIGGINDVLKYFLVDYFYIPQNLLNQSQPDSESEMISLTQDAVNNGAVRQVLTIGDEFNVGSAIVRVLGPTNKNYANPNNVSLVLKVIYGNTVFLFPSDAGREEERDLIETNTNLTADVLHVPHHGASESNEYRFIREVNPQYAIISVGTSNSYGHPDEKTLSVLFQAINDRDSIMRTDELGTIYCYSDGTSIIFGEEAQWTIERMLQESNYDNAFKIGSQVGPKQNYLDSELEKAKELVEKIIENNMKALPGYNIEKTFGNREELLPDGPLYTEFDLNPLTTSGRDQYRIVIGNDGSAWYTHNHYKSFIKIK